MRTFRQRLTQYPPSRSSLRVKAGPYAVALGAILLLTGSIFWRHLFRGHTFPWDFTATPHMAVFVSSTVGSGHFSEWIPFVGGGMPLAVNPLSGLYFPLWWLLGALGIPLTVSALTAIQVVHVALGAAGVFFLSRARQLPVRWSLAAAIPYVFFGGFFGGAQHENIFRGHAYAPWLLWALTIPRDGRPWRRLLILPLAAWVIASGAYAGQAIAFGLVGGIYLAVELWQARRMPNFRGLVLSLVPAALAAFAVVLAVYLPYLAADRGGQLYRPSLPTAQERSIWSLRPVGLLGLYLNPFAWEPAQATITAWSIGVPALVGVACLKRRAFIESAALVAVGLAATALAMLPSWAPAGRTMAAIPLIFSSRLPASDYKAMAAVAIVVLAAFGWRQIAGGRRPGPAPAVAGALLIGGTLLAPQVAAVAPTMIPWLVAAMVALCLLLVYMGGKLPGRALVGAVLILMVVDGARMIAEVEFLPGVSPWLLAGDDYPPQDRAAHDTAARSLRDRLDHPPKSRPAREPSTLPLRSTPGGVPADALGYLGTSYRVGDYGGTVMRTRWEAQADPELERLMLRPWSAWLLSCRLVDCESSEVELPDLKGGRTSGVTTTRYGLAGVGYRVEIPERSLMVENEFAAEGWKASRPDVKAVSLGGVLRGWVLPAGRYEFTTSYVQPQRRAQVLLASIGLLGLLGCWIMGRPKRAVW